MADTTIAERCALVHIKNIPENFAKLTGGDVSVQVTRAYNGGVPQADIISGRPVIADIVLERPFRPSRDRGLVRQLRKQVGSLYTDIGLQDLDANGQRVGTPETFTNCLLTKVMGRQYDETSNNPATIQLTFTPSNVT